MKIVNTDIKGLFLIKTNIFTDKRGFFKEVEKFKVLKKKNLFLIVFHFLKKTHCVDFTCKLKKAKQN